MNTDPQILYKEVIYIQFTSVTLCDPMDCSTPGLPVHHTNSWSLLNLTSIKTVTPFNHLILCRPLLLLPSIFPSIRVFSWVSSSHHVVKVLEFQLHYQSFQWIFRTDFLYHWLVWSPCSSRDFLSKSLLQHHSSKESILQCSALFIVQLSHPYMITGKTIALTRWTFCND